MNYKLIIFTTVAILTLTSYITGGHEATPQFYDNSSFHSVYSEPEIFQPITYSQTEFGRLKSGDQ